MENILHIPLKDNEGSIDAMEHHSDIILYCSFSSHGMKQILWRATMDSRYSRFLTCMGQRLPTRVWKETDMTADL